MITNIKEINRILLGVDSLTTSGDGALEKSVVEYCSGIVLEGGFSKHSETINFCLEAGLLIRKEARLFLSDTGRNVLSLNPKRNYSLNDRQKDVVIRECFLKGKLSKQVSSVIGQFKIDLRRKTLAWSETDGMPLKVDKTFLDLLIQINLIIRQAQQLLVNPDYASLISALKAPKHHLTDAELMERLEKQRLVGKVAEELALIYEKQRLADMGLMPESELVENISSVDVNAGFDMISFDTQTINLKHNRFIEVKGTSGSELSFILSNNELEVAKELGKKYWIYFLSGVDIESKTYRELKMLQDPTNSVMQDPAFAKDCMRVWVRSASTSE